jgi:hypothetical protein
MQRELTLAVAAQCALWAACMAVALLAAFALADRAVVLPLPLRAAMPWVAVLAGLAAAAWRFARAGEFRDARAVALWIERAEPALRYALVTRVDPAGAASTDALERAIARVPFEEPARRAAWRPLTRPAIALAIGAIVLVALPSGAVARVARPRAGDVIKANAAPGDALAHVAVTVTPPAYSGIAATTQDDAARVSALVGSAVRVEGAAVGTPVAVKADSLRVRLTADPGARWTADLAMPATATVLRFTQGTRERLLLLEPRTDSAPNVTLTAPARDSVLKTATGTIRLGASVSDDIGLDHGAFEVVISSGEGENFKFRTLSVARAALGNTRTGALSGALRLDTLQLQPGDLMHVRAIARDRNTVTGPGLGSSETRAIRIARAGEYDSVDVEGAPPPEERKGVISQRMLILLAEKLEKQRASLARPAFMDQALTIARDQNTLRKQVGDIVFSRLSGEGGDDHGADDAPSRANMTPEQLLAAANAATQAAGAEALDFAGGESPVVNINRPLLEAYNAMWDAGRELGIGDVKRALPHMYVALAAIQKARAAERVYLRGRPKDVVVDIARVRLAGKSDIIGPSARAARASVDDATLRRLARFDTALGLLNAQRAAATDSLLLLRAELLGAAPTLAAPLGEALDQLRAGKDATDALVAARRTLAGVSAHAAPLGAWGRAP